MSRSLTAAVAAALAAGNVIPVLLVELYYDSGTAYLAHNIGFNIAWNGNTYLGVASIGTIETVQESSEFEAHGLVGTISGSAANIGLAFDEDIQGRAVIMRLALLDSNHGIIADPVVCFSGRMDTMEIELGERATITVTAESRFAAWDTPRVRRWNHEDQIATHPTDFFFEFTSQMVDKQLVWGSPVAGANPPFTPLRR